MISQRFNVIFAVLLTGISLSVYANQTNKPPKTWTILEYVNLGDGDANDKSAEDLADEDKEIDDYVIKLLEKTGSTDQVNIIVERPYLKDKFTTRIQIEKSSNPNKVTSPVMQNLGFVDMGNYITLQDFLEWGVKNYPAQHYMVIMNVHGDGWYDDRKKSQQKFMLNNTKRFQTNFIMSPDNYTGNEITSPQLGKVVGHIAELIGHKVDILAFDSCYMLDIESATELADSTHLIIGSEDKVNSDAWPTEQLTAQIANSPAMTPEEVANTAINDIAEKYKIAPMKDEQQTFAIIAPDHLPALNNSIRKLSSSITHINNPDDLNKIRNSQSYALHMMDSNTHYDLSDFIKELQRSQIQSINSEDLTDIENLLNKVVLRKMINTNIYESEDHNARYKQLGGLGIWLSGTYYDSNAMKNYHELKFDIDTKWGSAIATWSNSD